jgi:ubiquinone/menaquinone biosynthesis C-methylase UbiE
MKLNLASHGDHIEGYVSVDFDHPSADINADVSCLPFEDDSISDIYASHILEHFRSGNNYEPHLSNPLNPKTVFEALEEWKRVLEPNGRLEIKVPDIDKIFWLIKNFPAWACSDGANSPFPNYSDWICSVGQHQSLFSKLTMTRVLQMAGFRNISFLDGEPCQIVSRSNLEMHVECYK